MNTSRLVSLALVLILYGYHGDVLHAQEKGHLHHVHMNVGSIEETTAFYQRHFGVIPVNYNNDDKAPALLLERAFLLMEETPRDEIRNHQLTGLTHVSWSAVDAPVEYVRLKAQGVEFYTPLTPLSPEIHYMYLYGPDHEVIEVLDPQPHHHFNHIHQMVKDPKVTAQWYQDNVNPVLGRTVHREQTSALFFDTLAFTFETIGGQFTPRENTGTLEPTDGSHLDHLAFSFLDLDAAYARMQAAGTRIESPITVDRKYGFRHFFTRAPNGVRVEFVEGKSWPEAAWE